MFDSHSEEALPVAVSGTTPLHDTCFCVRSFDCVSFSHFQFVADFHTENSSFARTARSTKIELKN